jgi:peptidoglycan/LPS O-acetylase OafA/YrhL
VKPAAVVFGWAALNAVLAAIMFAYGESLEFIGLYAAAVLLSVVAGVVVLLAGRRTPGWPRRMPGGSASAGFLGLAAILFALGFLFTPWVSYLAVFPLLLAVTAFRRERLPADRVPASSSEVRSGPLKPEPPRPGEEKAAKVAGFAAAALRAVAALRGKGRA